MGFLRRNKSERTDWKNVRCQPVEYQAWLTSVAERAPNDGRYYVAVMVYRGDDPCIIFETPATRSEAQTALRGFADDYGKQPQRVSETNFDDIDGLWGARRLGRREAAIQIIHPRQIDLLQNYVPPQDLHRQMGMIGRAQAVENPDAFFSGTWDIQVPANRGTAPPAEYGLNLDPALRLASPLDDLDTAGLDELLEAAQVVANYEPNDPRLRALDQSALNYLQSRLTNAKVEGMWAGAFFNPSDRSAREKLRRANEDAQARQDAALAALQAQLRELYQHNPTLLQVLQLEDETLVWLNLDDIADNL